jgi:hypothetical protein
MCGVLVVQFSIKRWRKRSFWTPSFYRFTDLIFALVEAILYDIVLKPMLKMNMRLVGQVLKYEHDGSASQDYKINMNQSNAFEVIESCHSVMPNSSIVSRRGSQKRKVLNSVTFAPMLLAHNVKPPPETANLHSPSYHLKPSGPVIESKGVASHLIVSIIEEQL